MKKIIIFGSILLAIFLLLGVLTNMQNKQQAGANPYKKDTLHPDTIKQLDDPVYQNLILPDELTEKLQNKDSAFIYFYSPTCSHCKVTTPFVVPMAEEMGIDLELYNLLEFQDGWDTYEIEGTPTIVYFENGIEASRIEGGEPEQFKQWFDENK